MELLAKILSLSTLGLIFFFLLGSFFITSWFVLLKIRGKLANGSGQYGMAVLILVLPLPLILLGLQNGIFDLTVMVISAFYILPLIVSLFLNPKDLAAPVDFTYRIGLSGLLIYGFKGLSDTADIETPYKNVEPLVTSAVFTRARYCVPMLFNPQSRSAKIDLFLFRLSLGGFLFLVLASFIFHFTS